MLVIPISFPLEYDTLRTAKSLWKSNEVERNMKILLATFWEIPHTGGVWKYMQQLKERLESLGHEVDLFGYGDQGNFVYIYNKNQKVNKRFFLGEIKQAFPAMVLDSVIHYYEERMYFYELAAKILGIGNYDLIHCQDVFSAVIFNRIRAKHTALVATLHGCVAHEILEAYYRSKNPVSSHGDSYFGNLEFNGATAGEITIIANNWMKNILVEEYNVPVSQLKIHHYGYDIETFLEQMNHPSPIQKPFTQKVIIYTGRLSEMKGVHHLIGALARLKKKRHDWVCWIVGDGPQDQVLQKQVALLGLDNEVSFFGKRKDIPYLLSLADILVLPTLIDNQPLSVIEAQLAGKAVIASNVGGVPEMIEHGMTGVLTPPGDEEMLAVHIDYLLEHEPYLANLGKRAKDWALTHWSLNQAIKKIVNIYEQAIFLRKTEIDEANKN